MITKTYKAIFSDFDGTLAGKTCTLSEFTKEAIRSLQKHNIHFVITSGRSFVGPIQQICEELRITSPQITRGGAEIIDPQQNNVIHGEYIADKDVEKLLTIFTEHQIDYWAEKGDCIYTKDGVAVAAFGDVSFKPLDKLAINEVPKLGIFRLQDPNKENEIEALLKKEFTTLHVIKSYSPSGKTWDITTVMANNQEAVLRVANMLDIHTSETIGIGDGYNDFSLLEAVGYKVAMGNAHQELKEIADEVIPPYDQDGVAVFINKLLGNKDICSLRNMNLSVGTARMQSNL